MIERFLKTYVFDFPLRYRLWLILMACILPLLWVGAAIRELWRSEPLYETYDYVWKSFKKGARR